MDDSDWKNMTIPEYSSSKALELRSAKIITAQQNLNLKDILRNAVKNNTFEKHKRIF